MASISHLELLPAIFAKLHVCEQVVLECCAGGNIPVPSLGQLNWVEIHPNPDCSGLPVWNLDAGERHTICLALEIKADWVLMDEKLGRAIAAYSGLAVTGTLGVLARAKTDGLIPSFREAAEAMRRRGIYFNRGLISKISNQVD